MVFIRTTWYEVRKQNNNKIRDEINRHWKGADYDSGN